jgi:FixJ family two-component response regulator
VSGLEFQSELAKANAEIPIIFITGHGDIPMTVKAMKAGAVEFLTKPFRDQDLLDAIQVALERARVKDEKDSAVSDLKRKFSTLTPREQEVMAWVTGGLLNKLIAAVHESAFGTKRTFRERVSMSAFGGKADIAQTRLNVRF